MFTTAFLLATLERAVKTFAQAFAALLVADGTDVLSTDWAGMASIAAMAAVASILTSVASGTNGAGPSVGPETLTEKVAAVEAPAAASEKYVAGPAADMPEGAPVDVVPDPDPFLEGNGEEDYRPAHGEV